MSLEDVHRRLIEQHATPSALIGPDDKVMRLSPGAGHFLLFPSGELTASVFDLARPELRIELRAGLHRVRQRNAPWRSAPILVRTDTSLRQVVLEIHPASAGEEEGFAIVLFRPADPADIEVDAGPDDGQADTIDGRLTEAESERDVARERLQAIIEEYETGQEELKASNEELQSANEELRSTLEELETSKEELQSMNEELQTVNQENRHKVEELAQLSDDLQNLLAATDIATLFLDKDLRILRFTPSVGELFNVLATDRGRPLMDIRSRIGYPELEDDARNVLRRLAPIERELPDDQGRWYLTRMLAYRSGDDRIEGVVITFIDITSRKAAEDALRQAHDTLEARVEERTRQVRELATRLTMAEHETRRRIGHVLHDDLQQQLYGARTKLAFVADEIAAGSLDAARSILAEVDQLIDDAVDMTRSLSVDLSPPLLESDGLVEALSWLVSHMRDLHGLDVEIETATNPVIDDEHTRSLLFQATRELLFNVAKHSGADRAVVEVATTDRQVIVRVRDDGTGFDPDHVPDGRATGLGLSNIGERLRFAGGDLVIKSGIGQGTVAEIRAPMRAQ